MKIESVLVIDDDAMMREVLTLLLGTEECVVTVAASSAAALAQLAAMPVEAVPAVVLTDLNMPGEPRAQVAVRLRRALPPDTLLLAMSASELTSEEQQSFDSFLRKPFSLEELTAAVERAHAHVTRARTTPGAGQTSKARNRVGSASILPSILPTLDDEVYEKLSAVMGLEPLATMYAMLTEDAEHRLARMRSAAGLGEEAAFSREAHALKGAFGMLGAKYLHALAGEMEAGGLRCAALLPEMERAMEQLRRILEDRLAAPLANLSRTSR